MSRKCAKNENEGKACRGMFADFTDKKVSQVEVQPWHRLGGVEHICELRKSTSVLYAILVTILRTIYKDRKGRAFGCPDVVWSANPQKTQMWIDTELRWEDTRPDFTPAIYVCLGEMQYEPVAPTLDMQSRLHMSHDGEQYYERMCSCSATLVHVCDRAGEACALADNTENYMSSLQDQIAQQYCFEHFAVVGRSALKKKEQGQTAGKDKLVSIVALKFDFADAWAVKIECPILKEVSMMEDGSAEIEFGDVSTETDTPVCT